MKEKGAPQSCGLHDDVTVAMATQSPSPDEFDGVSCHAEKDPEPSKSTLIRRYSVVLAVKIRWIQLEMKDFWYFQTSGLKHNLNKLGIERVQACTR